MTKALALMAGVAALCCPTFAMAQDETADGLNLEAETRVMVEAYDNGFRANAPASDEVLYVRTRIAAAWKHGPVELGGELYDARAYWDDAATPITASEVNALELVQLYAAVDLSQQVRVTVGRQMFDLGSKRLVANPGYRNAPNAYTGIRAQWDGGDAGEGTVFYVLPQDRWPADKPSIVANDVAWDRESFDLALWGGIYTRPLAGKISGEVYFYAWHRTMEEGEPKDLVVAGRYVDEYTCKNGEWRISRRREIVDWARTDPAADGFLSGNPLVRPGRRGTDFSQTRDWPV